VSEARRTAHDIITGILDVPRSWGIRHADLTLDPDVTIAARRAMSLIAAVPRSRMRLAVRRSAI
jgi:hypothetical protein